MKKSFPTAAVLGAASGYCLVEKGFTDIHEVFDHLYPGIMSGFSLIAMAKPGAVELLRQHPGISSLGPCTGKNYEDFLRRGLTVFGPAMVVEGPTDPAEAPAEAQDWLDRQFGISTGI